MVWRGDLGWAEALRSGRVEVNGQRRARSNVPRWLGQSPFASVRARRRPFPQHPV